MKNSVKYLLQFRGTIGWNLDSSTMLKRHAIRKLKEMRKRMPTRKCRLVKLTVTEEVVNEN